MGVKGLLKLLVDASEPTHLSSLSGKTVAVDMYCWLHRGAIACARDLALGRNTNLHVKHCVKFLKSLVAHNVTPILVFDGAVHPMKAREEDIRRKKREISLQTALSLEKQGNPQAHRHFAASVDITPQGPFCLNPSTTLAVTDGILTRIYLFFHRRSHGGRARACRPCAATHPGYHCAI